MKMTVKSKNGKVSRFVLDLNKYEAKTIFTLVAAVDGCSERLSPRKFTERLFKSLEAHFVNGDELDVFRMAPTANVQFAPFARARKAMDKLNAISKQMEALGIEADKATSALQDIAKLRGKKTA